MEENNKVDVIVVGAGPAGAAAGITLARAGKKVVILERGNFAGSKNMFGGAIYEFPTIDLYPQFKEEAPIERVNTEHRYILADEKSFVSINYKRFKDSKSYTVNRAKWDAWCIEQAEMVGAYFSPKTTVRELIVRDGKVIGIKTDDEDFYADIVIIADGVNSLLAKQIGLRKTIKDSDVALGVKAVIKLPKKVLEDRLNLEEGEGCIMELIGAPFDGMTAMGIIYAGEDVISLGLGINLDEMKKHKVTPNEMLNRLAEHPAIAPIIKDGEFSEYSAHLIPEGGVNAMPKLFGNGVMVVGDAAMLVNNVHFEGTNIAMLSGKIAAMTAIEAIDLQDFSEERLSKYAVNLRNTSAFKDLKTYKDVLPTVHANSNSFLKFYPRKVNEFFEMFTQSGFIPRASLYRRYLKNFIIERKISTLLKDIYNIVKLGINLLK